MPGSARSGREAGSVCDAQEISLIVRKIVPPRAAKLRALHLRELAGMAAQQAHALHLQGSAGRAARSFPIGPLHRRRIRRQQDARDRHRILHCESDYSGGIDSARCKQVDVPAWRAAADHRIGRTTYSPALQRRFELKCMTRHQFHVFANRVAAGRALAEALAAQRPAEPLQILALPRGGVPVACEVARMLDAPLDVLIVRKIGMPGQPELAIGAIAIGGVVLRNDQLPHGLVGEHTFQQLVERERTELARRERTYRAGLPPLDLQNRTAVLVDDGLATGATMLAAIRAARGAGAKSVVVAVPVASTEADLLVRAAADQTVVLLKPEYLQAIGLYYEQFPQLEDSEVIELLDSFRMPAARRDTHGA
jgi:putative phosphoribosyl transferase